MYAQANPEKDFPIEIVPPVQPKAAWRVAELKILTGLRLWVRFNDGTEGTVTMAGLIHSPHAGVFSALRDETLFAQAHIALGAVTWPGELDLAPDAMHQHIRESGEWVIS